MKKAIGAIAIAALLVAGIVAASTLRGRKPKALDAPWSRTPSAPTHVDHTELIQGPFASGPEVTRACLVCHPHAARDVMKTEHWTWAGDQIELPETGEVVQIGKRNLLNNYCIHAMPNTRSSGSDRLRECQCLHFGGRHQSLAGSLRRSDAGRPVVRRRRGW